MSYVGLRERECRARKRYRCIWCGQRIEIGERHVSAACVYDGDFHADRWHLECMKACHEYARSPQGLDNDGEFELMGMPRGSI